MAYLQIALILLANHMVLLTIYVCIRLDSCIVVIIKDAWGLKTFSTTMLGSTKD